MLINKMVKNKNSYTAANSLPLKILKDVEVLTTKKILPRHIQICPTNICNLKCPFCSCNQVERSQQLSIDQLKEIVDISKNLGTKAYTITGGGEPTLHPQINEFLLYCNENDISTGLVSNGLKLKNIKPEILKTLTWSRISFGDFRKFDDKFKEQINYAINNASNVDWAFSYVVGKDYNLTNIKNIINYANKNKFTHVRLVPDLYNVETIDMDKVKLELILENINLDLVIFQNRQEFCQGERDCLISLLKPLIAPDGYIYPCCGVQYALPNDNEHRMFPKSMRMGYYSELNNIINKQEKFDGTHCVKCYYKNYNTLLNGIIEKMKHEVFL